MITVNLLPENQRRHKNRIELKSIPFMPIVFLVVIIVLAIHVLLGMVSVYKRIQAISLNSRWQKAQPKIQEMEKLKAELRKKNQQINFLNSILERRFYASAVLNKINRAIPEGLWLNRLSIKKDSFIMEGSVFNFGIDEITMLNNFFNDLKKDDFFKLNFDNLDLASVRRRQVKDYEIVDFLLSAQRAEAETKQGIDKQKSKDKKQIKKK